MFSRRSRASVIFLLWSVIPLSVLIGLACLVIQTKGCFLALFGYLEYCVGRNGIIQLSQLVFWSDWDYSVIPNKSYFLALLGYLEKCFGQIDLAWWSRAMTIFMHFLVIWSGVWARLTLLSDPEQGLFSCPAQLSREICRDNWEAPCSVIPSKGYFLVLLGYAEQCFDRSGMLDDP